MIEAKFICSDLRGAKLTGAHVLAANVSRAVLNYARFTEVITSDEHLRAVKSRLGR